MITEDWCGDSSFNLAVIEKMASITDNIDLVIIERDSNFDIIDQYITNGNHARKTK